MFVESKEELLEKMKIANDAGMQIAVHAIGNAAIESILDCFKELESLNLKNIKARIFFDMVLFIVRLQTLYYLIDSKAKKFLHMSNQFF